MKDLKKIEGAKMLNAEERKNIKGGNPLMSCADMGLEYMSYDECMAFAPPRCQEYCIQA